MLKDNEAVHIETEDVQGLVVRGFGQLRHARFLLLSFGANAGQSREWVRAVRPLVTDAEQRPEERALQLCLTYRGLTKLGLDEEARAGFSIDYQLGMTMPHKVRILGDQGQSAPETWTWGGPGTDPIDVMLMIYSTSDEDLAAFEAEQRTLLGGFGASVVHQLGTHALFDGIGFREHFGFRDGVAQPRLRAKNSRESDADVGGLLREGASENTVEPGEFLLGYPNEYGKFPVSPGVRIDPTGKLPRKTYGRGGFDLGKNGSYLTLRQLEQDVEGFWRQLDDQAQGDAKSRERIAAKMVGRWPSGAPLVHHDEDTPGHELDNEFGYLDASSDDEAGLKCPLGSHIRRSNPRDSILSTDPEQATVLSNRHRIIRRARPYGAPVDPDFDLAHLLDKNFGDAARGLNFVCLGASIARQFEFVQHTWCNSGKFARLHDDPDPLIGVPDTSHLGPETPPPPYRMTIPSKPVRESVAGLQRHVHTRGGAYFFLPGLAALDYLGNLQPLTPLQKHAAFFDTNSNGKVRLQETYRGLRRLGVDVPKSIILTLIINLALGYLTHGRPSTQIDVSSINSGLHAFDSGVFDAEGKLDRAAFDALFDSATGAAEARESDAITEAELNDFISAQGDRGRVAPGFAHWFSKRETQLLLCLASDASKQVDGSPTRAITRRTLREFYEGDLFPKIERLLVYRKVGGFGLGPRQAAIRVPNGRGPQNTSRNG